MSALAARSALRSNPRRSTPPPRRPTPPRERCPAEPGGRSGRDGRSSSSPAARLSGRLWLPLPLRRGQGAGDQEVAFLEAPLDELRVGVIRDPDLDRDAGDRRPPRGGGHAAERPDAVPDGGGATLLP